MICRKAPERRKRETEYREIEVAMSSQRHMNSHSVHDRNKAAVDSGATVVTLHRLSDLQGYMLWATDGEIGSLEEVYFDDSTWTVRYFVVNSGKRLQRARALISSVAIGEINEDAGEISVEVSRGQIEGSPALADEVPVSRQFEEKYYRYFGWPPYWRSRSMSGRSTRPDYVVKSSAETAIGRQSDGCLRSSAEVSGYQIAAGDGEIGHAVDFVIDDKSWNVCYFEIDTGHWLPGKRVLLNPAWIEEINWHRKSLIVDLRVEDIREAPAYDPKSVISREYEVKLFEHYGRRKYWE